MFDLFINQEMRNIRRQHHISKEVILDWSAFVNVQDSHPYVAMGKISAETRRFFVALVMPLSVQILFRPTIADLAIAIRLRSSVEQPLLVVISDPRKLNCLRNHIHFNKSASVGYWGKLLCFLNTYNYMHKLNKSKSTEQQ